MNAEICKYYNEHCPDCESRGHCDMNKGASCTANLNSGTCPQKFGQGQEKAEALAEAVRQYENMLIYAKAQYESACTANKQAFQIILKAIKERKT